MMLFSDISVLDEHFEHQEHYYVGIADGKIAYLSATPPDADFGEVYDGRGKLLIPGFVNAHSHSAMTLMRGYAENLSLSDWLHTRIFPFEAQLDEAAIYDGTMLAAVEMLRFGITSTTDMYFCADANARAVLDSGIKMNLGTHVTCFDERGVRDLPVYAEWKRAIPAYNGAGNGRLRADIAIHAEYTSTSRVVAETAAFAKEQGVRLQMHLSETAAEHEACKERHGKTPAQYFSDLGAFDVSATAAHCVWLEGEDLDILADKGVTVASCPYSNLKLASGFVNAPELLARGVNVALGTDSVASNNNLSLFEEMKLFATLFKATTGDPTAITPKQALYAATRAGALAQGRTDCGLVKCGFCADLAVLDLRNRPYLYPCHNLQNNLVFSAQATDVCLTMIDGKVLYRDGEYTTLDLTRILSNAGASLARVLAKV